MLLCVARAGVLSVVTPVIMIFLRCRCLWELFDGGFWRWLPLPVWILPYRHLVAPPGYGSDKIRRFLLLDRTLGYLFLLPALLVILGLVAYPFANAIVMTFQQKTAGAPGRFIGLGNYRELLANEVFLRTVFNTVIYTAFGVGFKFFLGLGMALVLNQERRWNNLFRSFLLIPWAIPTVISALNWRWIYDDASGLINNVLVRLNSWTRVSRGCPTRTSPCSRSSWWLSGRARRFLP